DGNVYVADAGNQRIQKFTSTGAFITKWGSYGTGDGEFENPAGVATDATGNVYVTSGAFEGCCPVRGRIEKFTTTGTFLTQWSVAKGGAPNDVATDATGYVYEVNLYGSLTKYTSTGAV